MIFFRADSNHQIATGHIMRCISIAQRFKMHGHSVRFFISDDNPIPLLEKVGMDYYVLNSAWNDLDYEIPLMRELLKGHDSDFLIIDTYSVTKRYVESLLSLCKCCYLGSKREYLGELFALINFSLSVDYGYYPTVYRGKTRLILGPSYIPLREEFLEGRKANVTNARCKVMLTTGGSNPNHYMEKILNQVIRNSIFNQIDIEVVIGNLFENVDDLKEKLIQYGNIHVNENVNSMAEIMYQCDLAVTANGSTVYELVASHVPSITFCLAKDQINTAEKMAAMGLTEYCGNISEEEVECLNKISEKLTLYVCSEQKRIDLAGNAAKIIDGNGGERLYQALMYS